MLDVSLNVYLIEVNMNPCLELASPYLAQLLPDVIEDVIQVGGWPGFDGQGGSCAEDRLTRTQGYPSLLLMARPFAPVLAASRWPWTPSSRSPATRTPPS